MREVKSEPETSGAVRLSPSPAAAGDEIDPGAYVSGAQGLPYEDDPTRLPKEMKARMLEAGVVVDNPGDRSGTFIQVDHTAVHSSVVQDGIELLPVRAALEKYDWLSQYVWRAVDSGADRFTSSVEQSEHRSEYNGYFIRALPGHKTILPLQTCLYLGTEGLAQNVHNIVIAEEGSELHIITGCTCGPHSESGLHLGVSEFYVRRGATITFTMIHNWEPGIAVRPRTGIIVEEDGTFLSNYVIMKPVHDLQMSPVAHCVGEGAIVRFSSVIAGFPGAKMDIGSSVYLEAPRSRTEIVSRVIATGGEIVARGYIEGSAPDVKGHLECRGLILGDGGVIHAVPELRGTLAGIDLSHEAAVGKIAEEEVQYLMARGLTHDEATATIVRGFLHVDIEGLPDALNAELQRAIEANEKDLM
ncbi:MAG: SufD family Fe-S cluster assembly protein [Chloroflexi bacterium]|nr:SufD family Fe-S cluster assembly protein [Chloroflexota bacterium]